VLLSVGFDRSNSPPSESSPTPHDSPEFISQPQDLSDVEYDEDRAQGNRVEPKRNGYQSRIEQILYENPGMAILITYAGKNAESGGSYIAYTIRTGVWDHIPDTLICR